MRCIVTMFKRQFGRVWDQRYRLEIGALATQIDRGTHTPIMGHVYSEIGWDTLKRKNREKENANHDA